MKSEWAKKWEHVFAGTLECIGCKRLFKALHNDYCDACRLRRQIYDTPPLLKR